ncbi:MAG: hypothetical protein ACE5E6_02060 [Phycisphaerae bacterium]
MRWTIEFVAQRPATLRPSRRLAGVAPAADTAHYGDRTVTWQTIGLVVLGAIVVFFAVRGGG